MGLIQSILCTITMCVERSLTWLCCASFIIGLMLTILILMMYGMSVGYHYAEKDIAVDIKEGFLDPNRTRRNMWPTQLEELPSETGWLEGGIINSDDFKGAEIHMNESPTPLVDVFGRLQTERATEKLLSRQPKGMSVIDRYRRSQKTNEPIFVPIEAFLNYTGSALKRLLF